MMNIMYEHNIILPSYFKFCLGSHLLQFCLHQDSMLNMLLDVLCLVAQHRYKGHIRFVHQHLFTVKETKSGSIM